MSKKFVLSDRDRLDLKEAVPWREFGWKPVYEGIRLVGLPSRLHLAQNVSTAETLFNTSSGEIYVGEGTFFGQHCMVLAGSHFKENRLTDRWVSPPNGYDIVIGEGVWIASGAIIIGPCKIGDHAVIGAGSIVLPGTYEADCVYAGYPAVFKSRIDFKQE